MTNSLPILIYFIPNLHSRNFVSFAVLFFFTINTIHLIANAQLNVIKIAPLVGAMDTKKQELSCKIIHAGQHHVGHVMVDNVTFQQEHLEREGLQSGHSLAFK